MHMVCTVCTISILTIQVCTYNILKRKIVQVCTVYFILNESIHIRAHLSQLYAHFSPNILDTSQQLLEVSAVLEIGRLHSHDPWAGGGGAGLVNWSMSRHAFLRPDPLNAIANCPLRPTTAGHPGSQRAPQPGFSFLDSDITRWQKWIVSRACLSGDGVPGT